MRVAAIQMCSSHVVEENLRTAQALISEAARGDAKLVVLPEMFSIMGKTATDKVLVKESMGVGPIQEFLASQARENGVWIVGGTIPITCSDEKKVRAASLVFNDRGEMVARYDKIHLFDVTLSATEVYRESDTTEPGEELVVVDSPFGKLGLAVCYDVRFPELFIRLAQAGAEVIILPTAFTVPTGELHWELLTRARAADTGSYLIGACQGGTHSSGRKTYGSSLVVDPTGAVISSIPGVEAGVSYATIDLAKVHEQRKRIPLSEHRRIGIDAADTSVLAAKRFGAATGK